MKQLNQEAIYVDATNWGRPSSFEIADLFFDHYAKLDKLSNFDLWKRAYEYCELEYEKPGGFQKLILLEERLLSRWKTLGEKARKVEAEYRYVTKEIEENPQSHPYMLADNSRSQFSDEEIVANMRIETDLIAEVH